MHESSSVYKALALEQIEDQKAEYEMGTDLKEDAEWFEWQAEKCYKKIERHEKWTKEQEKWTAKAKKEWERLKNLRTATERHGEEAKAKWERATKYENQGKEETEAIRIEAEEFEKEVEELKRKLRSEQSNQS